MIGRRKLAVAVAVTAVAAVLLMHASPVVQRAPTAAGVTAGRFGVPAASSSAQSRRVRPNIVFIMVDDMRDDELRFMPSTRTLVGAAGVRFVNSFAPFSLCCPARASVLTGQYTHNHGVYDVKPPYGFHSFDDRATLATALRGVGYTTMYLGKYLNGYGLDPPPRSTSASSLSYVPPGWSVWRGAPDGGFAGGSAYAGSVYSYFDTSVSLDGRGFQSLEGEYQTRAFGRLAEGLIRSRAPAPGPFMLYLSFAAPHHGLPDEPDDPRPTRQDDGTVVEWVTPARPDEVKGRWDSRVTAAPGVSWRDPDITDKPSYIRSRPLLNDSERQALLEVARQRAEALTVVDQEVRRLVRVLSDIGELRRTLVVFTSDNGYFLGEQRQRQGKIAPHEPSLRVPLLMRGPGIPAGETRRDPFTSIDFLPTLVSAAGTEPHRRVDGVSLWDVARFGDRGWTRGIMVETNSMGRRPRSTNFAGQPLTAGGRRDFRFLIGVRTARYLYLDVARQRNELYDVVRDPRQYRNLQGHPRYADVERMLRRQLTLLRTCRGPACRQNLPDRLMVGTPSRGAGGASQPS